MTQQDPSFDLRGLFQIAVVIVLFGLPALRGILRARQERQQKERGEARGKRRSPAAGTGKEPRPERPPLSLEDLFPELSEEEPAPTPILTPIPAPAPAPAPVARRDPLVDRSPEPGRLGSRIPRSGPRPQLRPELGVTFEALSETDLTTRKDNLRPVRRRRRRAPLAGDWKRAVVLAEVLGTPVSLREGGAWPGAPRGL